MEKLPNPQIATVELGSIPAVFKLLRIQLKYHIPKGTLSQEEQQRLPTHAMKLNMHDKVS